MSNKYIRYAVIISIIILVLLLCFYLVQFKTDKNTTTQTPDYRHIKGITAINYCKLRSSIDIPSRANKIVKAEVNNLKKAGLKKDENFEKATYSKAINVINNEVITRLIAQSFNSESLSNEENNRLNFLLDKPKGSLQAEANLLGITIEEYKDVLKERVLADRYKDTLQNNIAKPTDKEIEKHIEDNSEQMYDLFEGDSAVIQIIYTDTKKKAEEALKALLNYESFNKVLEEYSYKPIQEQRGGQTGRTTVFKGESAYSNVSKIAFQVDSGLYRKVAQTEVEGKTYFAVFIKEGDNKPGKKRTDKEIREHAIIELDLIKLEEEFTKQKDQIIQEAGDCL